MSRCGKSLARPCCITHLVGRAGPLGLLVILLTRLACGSVPESGITPSMFGVSEWKYTSAQVCRRCHPDHYEMWSHSMHALAVEDPIFQVSYLQAQVMGGDSIRERCLTCHAPLAAASADFSLSSELSREGVTCDFCHTVTDVHIGRTPTAYENRPGATKYGPISARPTPAHASKQSDLFKSAKFCGGCHELVNEHGVLVMGTFSEWRAGPYPAQDVHCQNCHMPLTMAPAAITLEGDTSETLAHDHQFQGGHTRINLKHAADLDVNTKIQDRTAHVRVVVTNKESGHKLPTGMPERQLVLNVIVYDQDGKILAQPTRIYRKVLVDADGTILEGNSNQLLHAVRVYDDNRIAPKERRTEEYLVDLPPGVTSVRVRAELIYEYETPVMYTEKIKTEMATAEASCRVSAHAPIPGHLNREIRWLIGFGLVFSGVLAATMVLVKRRRRTRTPF